MREIKFRGFHKPTNKMIDLKKITPLALDADLNQDGLFIPFSDHVVLMQFTGLKDKNGKDIYDGDRVKRRLVDFEKEGGFAFVNCDVRWNGWCYALFVMEKQLCGLDPIVANEIEITGNIYETN